jgi:hypothetical protein
MRPLHVAQCCRSDAHFIRAGARQGIMTFFALASASWTLTSPRLRLRMATPVWHQVRSFCQVMPASCSTAQIVYVLTLGRPSGARRSARCNVFSDQVAVPFRSRCGGRRNSVRIRSRSGTVLGRRSTARLALHSPQSESVQERHPLRDRIAHRPTDQSCRFGVQPGIARREQGLCSRYRQSRCTVAARQPLQSTPLGVRQRTERILLVSAHTCPPRAVLRD